VARSHKNKGNVARNVAKTVNGILTRANPNIRIFDNESADFSQIFEDLTKYLAKYLDSSNPNRASGGSNIRFAVHCAKSLTISVRLQGHVYIKLDLLTILYVMNSLTLAYKP